MIRYYYSRGSQSENFFIEKQDKNELIQFYENQVRYTFNDVLIPERIEEVSWKEFNKRIDQLKYVK